MEENQQATELEQPLAVDAVAAARAEAHAAIREEMTNYRVLVRRKEGESGDVRVWVNGVEASITPGVPIVIGAAHLEALKNSGADMEYELA